MREEAQSETERIIGWDEPPKSGSKVVQQLQDRQRTEEDSGALYASVFLVCAVVFSGGEYLLLLKHSC